MLAKAEIPVPPGPRKQGQLLAISSLVGSERGLPAACRTAGEGFASTGLTLVGASCAGVRSELVASAFLPRTGRGCWIATLGDPSCASFDPLWAAGASGDDGSCDATAGRSVAPAGGPIVAATSPGPFALSNGLLVNSARPNAKAQKTIATAATDHRPRQAVRASVSSGSGSA